MRRIAWIGAAVLVLGLAMQGAAWADGAITGTFHFSFPQDFVLPNPCTGDLIAFTGDTDAVVHVTNDPAGGVHVASPTWVVQTIGVDLTTGQTFREVGAVPSQENFTWNGSRLEYTVIGGTNFVGPGPGNNLIQHEIIHVTIDANGNTAASVDNLSIECR